MLEAVVCCLRLWARVLESSFLRSRLHQAMFPWGPFLHKAQLRFQFLTKFWNLQRECHHFFAFFLAPSFLQLPWCAAYLIGPPVQLAHFSFSYKKCWITDLPVVHAENVDFYNCDTSGSLGGKELGGDWSSFPVLCSLNRWPDFSNMEDIWTLFDLYVICFLCPFRNASLSPDGGQKVPAVGLGMVASEQLMLSENEMKVSHCLM